MNKSGDVKVEEISEARILEDDSLWEHIATIEPKSYLHNIGRFKTCITHAIHLNRLLKES